MNKKSCFYEQLSTIKCILFSRFIYDERKNDDQHQFPNEKS